MEAANPTAMQTILMIALDAEAAKLLNGIIITVAAITIPTIAWNAIE